MTARLPYAFLYFCFVISGVLCVYVCLYVCMCVYTYLFICGLFQAFLMTLYIYILYIKLHFLHHRENSPLKGR